MTGDEWHEAAEALLDAPKARAYLAFGKTYWVCSGEPQVALGLCISKGESPVDVRLYRMPPGLGPKSGGTWTIDEERGLVIAKGFGAAVELDTMPRMMSVPAVNESEGGER